jgi:YbbR domain-containing protein
MLLAPFRWLVKNFSTLLLSFGLAIVVWISAVTAADPNETRILRGVPLEVIGKAPDLLLVKTPPSQISVTLFAARSQLDRYANQIGLLRATLDLTGLESGAFQVPVEVSYSLTPTRLVRIEPEILEVQLDRLISQVKSVRLMIAGRPARGYQAEFPSLDVARVTLSGPQGQVSQVEEVVAALDISDADATLEVSVPLKALDAQGEPVSGVQLTPDTARIRQPITLLGGYRNVVVKVVSAGQVANGYRLTNISVSPPSVTVFSANPELVNKLPGFVETEPLDLSGVTDDLDVRLALNLPEGVAVVGEQNVLVQVSIAAIESSLSLPVTVEVVGLGNGLTAQVSPQEVVVLLSGPVLVLDALRPADVRVLVDLADLQPGIYQVTPLIELLPERVILESILPGTIEVTIASQLTPTPAAPAP